LAVLDVHQSLLDFGRQEGLPAEHVHVDDHGIDRAAGGEPARELPGLVAAGRDDELRTLLERGREAASGNRPPMKLSRKGKCGFWWRVTTPGFAEWSLVGKPAICSGFSTRLR